jgi:hypothetical protein
VIAERVREKEERLVTLVDFICKEFQMQSQQINVAIQDDLVNLHFPKRASGSFGGAKVTISEMDEIFERYLITEAMKDLQKESECQDMTDQQQLDYIRRIAAQTLNTPCIETTLIS